MTTSLLNRLFAHDAAGGVVLMLATAAALTIANSPLMPAYLAGLEAPLSITLGGTGLTLGAMPVAA